MENIELDFKILMIKMKDTIKDLQKYHDEVGDKIEQLSMAYNILESQWRKSPFEK